MKRMAHGVIAVAVAVSCLALSGCDSAPHVPTVIHVPADATTIQGAVDRAGPGDLILVSEGTYVEEVLVDVADVTIRGEDRNGVILDGEHALHNGITVVSDGVSIENLTVHSFRVNGVIITGTGGAEEHLDYDVATYPSANPHALHYVERFRVSYVTTYNNGLYGIYAFQSRNGVIEQSYASGHPDSGIYVGQCTGCNTVVDSVVLENNAIGYYGTNASDNVYLVRSIMRGNRLGATPNSQDEELLAPQVKTFVVGNVISDNDNPNTPPIERGFFGGGIGIGGGFGNYVARNLVTGHSVFGIGIVVLNPYDPANNIVEGNVVTDNGVDLLYAPSPAVTSTLENCFSGNTFVTSIPEAIEAAMPCGQGDLVMDIPAVRFPEAPKGVDYREMASPGAQPTMPGDLSVLPLRLPDVPDFPELDSILVPTP